LRLYGRNSQTPFGEELIKVELFGGPKDGEFIEMYGIPSMEMMMWIEGTNSTYGWSGNGEFRLTYMGEREQMK
jgi:hypothetical protein